MATGKITIDPTHIQHEAILHNRGTQYLMDTFPGMDEQTAQGLLDGSLWITPEGYVIPDIRVVGATDDTGDRFLRNEDEVYEQLRSMTKEQQFLVLRTIFKYEIDRNTSFCRKLINIVVELVGPELMANTEFVKSLTEQLEIKYAATSET